MDNHTQILFLRKLQRLLDEGEFVATYKFALLQSIADLSVESSCAAEESLELSLDQIAEKFVEYFWRQAIPYRADAHGASGILKHNTGNQAAVVTLVLKARDDFGGRLSLARADTNYWRKLIREVGKVVEKMPLWKLQVIAGTHDEFIYRRSDFMNRKITMLPGVAANFRSFHGLISRLVRSSWVDQIRAIRGNQSILGDSPDLDEFLFGSERQSLNILRPIFSEIQESRCFYCEGLIRNQGQIDHFIAWSRYSIDLGHNFVLSHDKCNGSKSDFLADPQHLSRWMNRNKQHGYELCKEFDSLGFPHDLQRSLLVTKWAYEQGERSGAHTWLRAKTYLPITDEWRKAMVCD